MHAPVPLAHRDMGPAAVRGKLVILVIVASGLQNREATGYGMAHHPIVAATYTNSSTCCPKVLLLLTCAANPRAATLCKAKNQRQRGSDCLLANE
jgi:hypothetical protein